MFWFCSYETRLSGFSCQLFLRRACYSLFVIRKKPPVWSSKKLAKWAGLLPRSRPPFSKGLAASTQMIWPGNHLKFNVTAKYKSFSYQWVPGRPNEEQRSGFFLRSQGLPRFIPKGQRSVVSRGPPWRRLLLCSFSGQPEMRSCSWPCRPRPCCFLHRSEIPWHKQT